MEAFEKAPFFCWKDGKAQAQISGPQDDIDRLISRAARMRSCLEETGRFKLETHLACRCQRRAS